jgi:bloom syndrome protein
LFEDWSIQGNGRHGTSDYDTILHMALVLKGSEVAKIKENRHNSHPCYGKLKSWDKIDIERLMHKMVLEQYLKEELKFAFDNIQSYIHLGPRAEILVEQKRENYVFFSR